MVSTPEKPVAPASVKAATSSATPWGEAFVPSDELRLVLPESWDITERAFLDLCRRNEMLRFETTEDGALIIMVGEGWDTSRIGMRLGSQLLAWSDDTGAGGVGGASGTVRISDTAMSIPDVCWVSDERIAQQPEDYEGVLLAACPEFVIEIRSESESLESQQRKMERWMQYGVLLGWLVDPREETVLVFRADEEPEMLQRPAELSGENVCDGLIVDFSRVWKSSD